MWLCNSGGIFSGVYSGVSDVHERLCKLQCFLVSRITVLFLLYLRGGVMWLISGGVYTGVSDVYARLCKWQCFLVAGNPAVSSYFYSGVCSGVYRAVMWQQCGVSRKIKKSNIK